MTIHNELFERAQKSMPGGVSSPVRAFKSVGGTPIFMKRGDGPYLYDESGKEFIDFVGSWGPLILGHSHPKVVAALSETIKNGTSFGTVTKNEILLAELLIELVPSLEKVRLVNSGTEATMSAIRLARGFTGKDKIVKFTGNYHGHSDGLLIKAGSGATTLGIPDSPGVPPDIAKLTVPADFNDCEGLKNIFAKEAENLAAVIIEPVAGNMGVIPPQPGFLETMRELCSNHNVILIFDEVMTGFRVAKGGAQEKFNIRPDLTCLGKVIGGGLPVGAYGGRADIMEHIAPAGPIYQAGTLSGNPLAVAAGITTLQLINEKGFYENLEKKCHRFEMEIQEKIRQNNWPLFFQRVGTMATLFFNPRPVTNYAEAMQCDTAAFAKFFHHLIEHGIYYPPSQFEAFFISAAHTDPMLDRMVAIVNDYCYKYF